MNAERFFINFDITNYCNLRCSTCYRERDLNDFDKKVKLNNRYLDFALFKEVIFKNKSFLKNKVCYLCGEMGDPMMHPELEKFVNISTKIFKTVEIHTNGFLRSSEWVKRASKKYDKVVFVFAIDGVS